MTREAKRRLQLSITGSLLLLVLLVASACTGTATAKQVATLRILEGQVEVQEGDADPAPGVDGASLNEGDIVITGPDGRAAIEYFDGSETRLDFNTSFELVTLETIDNDAGSKVIEASQANGNSYNRVTELTDAESRFDIETPTATASVQGTDYAVILNPDGSTTVATFDGTVSAGAGDSTTDVLTGTMVVIGADGTVGDPQPIPDDLLNSDWITFNQCEVDQVRDCTPEPPPDEPTEEPEEPEPTEGPTVEQVDEAAAPGDYPPAASTCGATVAAGTNEITVTGQGWTPGQTVTITLDGEKIGEAVADENGSFTVVITLSGVSDGEHTIGCTDVGGNQVSNDFDVVGGVVSEPAFTGSTLNVPLWLAMVLVLMVAGVALVLIGRRRRHEVRPGS
ncbi:MAG TPA: FecR domain-containing protein [Actinomycetota bacterium]|nr:FecR domain-containing protein [Actinomycetota bacterium]